MLAPAPTLTVVAQDDAEIRQLRQEVAGMRQVIEREMNRFTDERLRGCPVRATALDLMDEYGFDAGWPATWPCRSRWRPKPIVAAA
jgi:flagellar biosynthesis protein FlhF